MSCDDRDFYDSLPVLADFADAVKAENYRPLPDGWVVGFSDVVGSTEAVAEGRYKAVNMVGAGVVAAVSNALERRAFPFVFGGDGASFAVSAADAPAASAALRAMASFSRMEFQIDLRAAAAAVGEIRAAGRDVRVARFGASKHTAYAMFAGGGLAWLEARAKRGEVALPPAPPGARPDLSGLSCRWTIAPARHGVILSVIVAPRGEDPRFAALLDVVVRMAQGAADGGRPIAAERLSFGEPGVAISLEAAAARASGASRMKSWVAAAKRFLMAAVFHRFMLRAGSFDMAAYVSEVVANADFRKFDDGLLMTLDCTPAFADALEARLATAEDFADYGTFRQTGAQLTCLVPSYADRGHVHFVDGADGGYTMAASAMKARRLLKATASA
jgi:DUF3095 family protein